MSFHKYEVYWADVEFEDLPVSKKRPVLILDDKVVLIHCLPLSSHTPKVYDYVIKDWKGAGLTKPTVVILSKALVLNVSAFHEKIGKLEPVDILGLQERL